MSCVKAQLLLHPCIRLIVFGNVHVFMGGEKSDDVGFFLLNSALSSVIKTP